MATIEISQASVAADQPGTRYDLIPREAIICTAIDPAPGGGVSYTWEIEDAAGSAAVLDATTGTVVNIGVGGSLIHPYCAFKIRMVANDNGNVTETTITVGVPHPLGLMVNWGSPNAARSIIPEMFAETSDPDATIDANDPTASTDNFIREIADTGVNAANWRGWSSKDYDAKKRLLDQTFVQGWEIPISRESGDPGPEDITLFDISLNTMRNYFPVEQWGMQPTFEIDVIGATLFGFPMNIHARIQYNVLSAWFRDNSFLADSNMARITLNYGDYDCPVSQDVDPPETVLTPNPPTGGTGYLYDGNGTEPDGIYLLPYLRRNAIDDWNIVLKLVTADMSASSDDDEFNAKVRVKLLMTAPDTTGWVDPDFAGPLPSDPPS
jgi:hypothetical protein